MTSSNPPLQSPLAALRARFILTVFFLSLIVPWIAIEILWPGWVDSIAAPVIDALLGLGAYVALFAIVILAVYRVGMMNQFPVALGPAPSRDETLRFAYLSIPLLGISLVGMYLLYVPLSYPFPDFVTSWVLETPTLIWWDPNVYWVTASLINGFLMVILAPVLEELIFRGFLLNRWQAKYGTNKAIIFSSLIFALVHVEILGGFVFATLLSLIYLKTKSLIGPIIVHMANNAIVLLIIVSEGIWTGEIAIWTLDEFRSSWSWAIVGAIVGIPWIYSYTRKLLESFQKKHHLTDGAIG